MLKLETSIERSVVAKCRAMGIDSCKLDPRSNKGWPDRIFFVNGGKPIILEFKCNAGGAVDALQQKRIAYLATKGYNVHVVDNEVAALRILSDPQYYVLEPSRI